MTDLIKRLMDGVKLAGDLMRPLLTFFITLTFNVVLAWGVFTGRLSVTEYVQTMGPMNSMILGFWFGIKTATPGGRP